MEQFLAETLHLSKVEVQLQQWPLRPGWKMAKRIMALFPDDKNQQLDLDTLLSEANLEFAIEIMAHGIEAENFENAKALVEGLGMSDGVQLLEAVLRHNLGFLLDRLNQLRIESGPGTTRP